MRSSDRLLELSAERREQELRRVEEITELERAYFRRRRVVTACSVGCYLLGLVVLGAAFHTTDLALAGVFLLLGPLIGSFGPLAIWYAFWVSEGDL